MQHIGLSTDRALDLPQYRPSIGQILAARLQYEDFTC